LSSAVVADFTRSGEDVVDTGEIRTHRIVVRVVREPRFEAKEEIDREGTIENIPGELHVSRVRLSGCGRLRRKGQRSEPPEKGKCGKPFHNVVNVPGAVKVRINIIVSRW
jgi:hypothetical protein